MNKKELIASVSQKVDGLSKKEVAAVVDVLLDSIAEDLEAGNKVSLTGFGVFSVVLREARAGRNPQTGASIQIEAKKAVKFKASKTLKDSVSGIKSSEPSDDESE